MWRRWARAVHAGTVAGTGTGALGGRGCQDCGVVSTPPFRPLWRADNVTANLPPSIHLFCTIYLCVAVRLLCHRIPSRRWTGGQTCSGGWGSWGGSGAEALMRSCPRCMLAGMLMPVTALPEVFAVFRGGGAGARVGGRRVLLLLPPSRTVRRNVGALSYRTAIPVLQVRRRPRATYGRQGRRLRDTLVGSGTVGGVGAGIHARLRGWLHARPFPPAMYGCMCAE